ncbi:MAG: GAF domain-containing protein [Rhizomicrobium sp.]
MLKANVVILLPHRKTRRLEIRVGYPPEDELDAQDLAAATWSWERGKPAGRNSETLPGTKRLFLPMRTGEGLVGVIGLQRAEESALLTPEERPPPGLADRPDGARHRALRARRAGRRGAGAPRG